MATRMAGGALAGAHRSFALFEYGFRPFFLLAGAYGAAGLLAWIGLFSGAFALPLAWPEMLWHGHEMVFGFAAAGMGGFMLTAVPNWTGAAPLRGSRLAVLTLLWLAGRVAMWGCAALPGPLVALLDLAFLPALAVSVGGSLVAQIPVSGYRNAVFLVLLTLLWLGDLLTQLDALGAWPGAALPGLHLGIDVLLLAITMVGGRIIPTFTANALRLAGGGSALPRSYRPLDAASIIGMVAYLLADTLIGGGPVLGAIALFAVVANGARLALWQPLATWRNPLLWVLHLGYGWLVLGLALSGVANLAPAALPPTTALHALTAGAIGTMLLAVMSRAALGHTGRPLAAPPAVVSAYAAISIAAALRVIAPLTAASLPLLIAAGLIWALGMALFTAAFAPILLRPRADGKPG